MKLKALLHEWELKQLCWGFTGGHQTLVPIQAYKPAPIIAVIILATAYKWQIIYN